MGTKISDLPSVTSLTGTEEIPIVQTGTTKKVTKQLLTNDNYSTTEQVVGTWINGKPLYRKVFTAYMPTTSADGTYANNLTEYATNIEYAWIVAHWTTDSSGQNQPLPYFTNSGYFAKAFITNNQGTNGYKYFVANAIKAFNGQPITVIVQYTKSTDNVS